MPKTQKTPPKKPVIRAANMTKPRMPMPGEATTKDKKASPRKNR